MSNKTAARLNFSAESSPMSGDEFRLVRKGLGLSQTELAEKLGARSKRTILRIESAPRVAPIYVLALRGLTK